MRHPPHHRKSDTPSQLSSLAGVLYAGDELPDLDRDALGGFWVVVDGSDFTTTEVVREPGALGEGRFPYISEQALTVAPGTYTLVVWVDFGLSPVSRWVPLNSDGMGWDTSCTGS